MANDIKRISKMITNKVYIKNFSKINAEKEIYKCLEPNGAPN